MYAKNTTCTPRARRVRQEHTGNMTADTPRTRREKVGNQTRRHLSPRDTLRNYTGWSPGSTPGGPEKLELNTLRAEGYPREPGALKKPWD